MWFWDSRQFNPFRQLLSRGDFILLFLCITKKPCLTNWLILCSLFCNWYLIDMVSWRWFGKNRTDEGIQGNTIHSFLSVSSNEVAQWLLLFHCSCNVCSKAFPESRLLWGEILLIYMYDSCPRGNNVYLIIYLFDLSCQNLCKSLMICTWCLICLPNLPASMFNEYIV